MGGDDGCWRMRRKYPNAPIRGPFSQRLAQRPACEGHPSAFCGHAHHPRHNRGRIGLARPGQIAERARFMESQEAPLCPGRRGPARLAVPSRQVRNECRHHRRGGNRDRHSGLRETCNRGSKRSSESSDGLTPNHTAAVRCMTEPPFSDASLCRAEARSASARERSTAGALVAAFTVASASLSAALGPSGRPD
jgi:hypothetical protein